MNVTVWRCDLDREVASLDTLDAAERTRAAAFAFEHLRRRYIVAHSFLRSVLGSALGIAPAAICFESSQHGKPHLANPTAIAFNLSHAQSIAYVAIAPVGDLGIDVELHHRIDDLMAVARTVFSPLEIRELEREQGDALVAGFLRCWTRKEAYVKALGVGLGAELRDITVHPNTVDITVPSIAGVSDVPFFVRTVPSREGEYVAIASTHTIDRIEVREFRSPSPLGRGLG